MRDFLEKIEYNQGIFSTMKVDSELDLDFFLKRKNLTLVKSISTFSGGNIIYEQCLFRTTAGFYLYLRKKSSVDLFELEIFHKEEHINEIIIFLKQIIKK